MFKSRKKSIVVVLMIALAAFLYFRRIPPPPPREVVVPIANTSNDDRRADVVFIHGLGGDGIGTWTSEFKPYFYWPEELGDQFKDLGVWAVNYDAQASDWLGHTMPIEDRSKFLLDQFRIAGIGDRRVIFVTHSLGGILVKQMLYDAMSMNEEEWFEIGCRCKGVVFLATPNSGSDVASMLRRIAPVVRANVTQQQLESNAPVLRNLNIWYRNNVENIGIETKVLYETMDTNRMRIVDESSADPGISGVTPIGVDADHISISKPNARTNPIYLSVAQFIDEEAVPLPTSYDITLADFVIAFEAVRHDPLALRAFKKEHVGQQVEWTGIVRRVNDHPERPSYSIGAAADSPAPKRIIASFRPRKFDKSKTLGDQITIVGVLAGSTTESGAIVRDCIVAEPASENEDDDR